MTSFLNYEPVVPRQHTAEPLLTVVLYVDLYVYYMRILLPLSLDAE